MYTKNLGQFQVWNGPKHVRWAVAGNYSAIHMRRLIARELGEVV